MAGRSYDESVQVLLRGLKNSESQTRAESLVTLEKVISSSIFNKFKLLNNCLYFSCLSCVVEWVQQHPISIVISLRPASYVCQIET
jgi:hypothetical protein